MQHDTLNLNRGFIVSLHESYPHIIGSQTN